jgi:hypothetical protein
LITVERGLRASPRAPAWCSSRRGCEGCERAEAETERRTRGQEENAEIVRRKSSVRASHNRGPAKGGRQGAPAHFLGGPTVQAAIRKALKACGLPETLSLYQISRHTYASQFALGGGSIEKLQVILGHASVTRSQRYAHLRADMFRPADLPALQVDMSREGGALIDMAAHRGGKKEAGGPAVAMATVDDTALDGVSTDSL